MILAGLTVVGCAADTPTTPDTQATTAGDPGVEASPGAPAGTDADMTASATPRASASDGGPSTGPAAPAEPAETTAPAGDHPTREEIIAQFEGRTPSEFGLEVTGIIQRSESPKVALTFDACGGPNGGDGYDEALIFALRELEVPATLFCNTRWIDANPAQAKELAQDPLFEIANHGVKHRPLSVTGQEAYGINGTQDVGDAYDEVMGCVEAITELTGKPPLWFRSGTAHADEVGVEIVNALGLRMVNFDINGDAGATFSASQVEASVAKAREGSVVIGHMNRPGSGTAEGVRRAIPQLRDKGLEFATLAHVLPAPA